MGHCDSKISDRDVARWHWRGELHLRVDGRECWVLSACAEWLNGSVLVVGDGFEPLGPLCRRAAEPLQLSIDFA